MVFAERQEVGRTAQDLGLSAPVVSRRLQEFQGDPYALVEKRGNAVVLTPKGTAALPDIARAVRGYDQLVAHLTGRAGAPRCLRIAAGGGIAFTPLPQAIAAFRQSYPDTEVRVIGSRGRDRIRALVRGEVDLALVTHEEHQIRTLAGDGADLRIEVVREQGLLVVAARDSEAGTQLETTLDRSAVPLALLATWPLLGIEEKSGIRRQLDAAVASAGGAPLRPVVYPGGWEAAFACARLGVGVAILPEGVCDRTDAGVVCRPFLPDVRVTDRLAWRERDDDSVSAFLACIRSTLLAKERS